MSLPEQNKSEHIFQLAKVLLDDIELSRLSGEPLILRATRLARLINSEEIQSWLQYELKGYTCKSELEIKYMTKTRRWANEDEDKDEDEDEDEEYRAYWESFAHQEAAIQALEIQLTQLRPQKSATSITIISNSYQRMRIITKQIQRHNIIKSNVIALLHEFVSGIYYEKAFSGLAENIFESYKRGIDATIAEKCGDVLSKLPYVYDRLREGDSEAVSQGLTTCRRIIDTFADAIYPPTEKTVQIGKDTLKLNSSCHKNRINVYIRDRVFSDSRRERLRQSLSNLYGRVSTGVHNEVSPEEAQALVLSTYLFLGEVLNLDIEKSFSDKP
jgi:hypothetical protein